jgi:hypothetical protein
VSTKAQAILEEIEGLPPAELRELWRELTRRVSQRLPAAPIELCGEPLTDDDLAETARITFQMLDEEERRAQPR